ncbi:hypothetical protein D3C78_1084850 [compost metagenome]
MGFVGRQGPRRHVATVVKTADDQRAVRVAVEELNHNFIADTGKQNATESTAGTRLSNTYPAGTLVVKLAITVPMELKLHPTKFVGIDFFAGRPNHECSLWPNDHTARCV